MVWLDFRNCMVVLLLGGLSTGSGVLAFSESEEPFSVQNPFEAVTHEAECIVDQQGDLEELTVVFEKMKEGSQQAVACVRFLEGRHPGWQTSEGAQGLVGSFVSYLLGDGTSRGLQRHAIFLDLLGQLEKIAPDWRLRDEVDERLPEIILGSVVEDPFVANFWRSAVEEADLGWRETAAARSILPELYSLAVTQAQRPENLRNKRAKALLKELSWARHTRLILATRVYDTWPKRVLWVAIILLALIFMARWMRRRKITA